MFGRRSPRKTEAAEGTCPAWAVAYLLHGTEPEHRTPDWREYVHSMWMSSVTGKPDVPTLWKRHRAELLAKWRRLGRRGRPFGATYDR